MSSRPEDAEFLEMNDDEERRVLAEQHRRSRVWLIAFIVMIAVIAVLTFLYVTQVGLVESGIRRSH